jgi:hypothetical protein
VKKKKVIRKSRRHGKRSKARAFDPVAVEVAKAFHMLVAIHWLIKQNGSLNGVHEPISQRMAREIQCCHVEVGY